MSSIPPPAPITNGKPGAAASTDSPSACFANEPNGPNEPNDAPMTKRCWQAARTLAGLGMSATALLAGPAPGDAVAPAPGLVGYWKLHGDCRDYSGQGNHGINHGVDLSQGAFDGRGAHVEVPAHPSLRFGTGDFALTAWIYTAPELDDVVGDILDLYDPAQRRGLTLSVISGGSGYQGPSSDRRVCF